MDKNGRKIFYITRNLCSALSDMKLTIDCEFLQSPFEEMYLYLDQDDISISDFTGRLPVKGVYINLQRVDSFHRKFRFLATTGIKGIETGHDINNYASFLIPDHGELEKVVDMHLDLYKENNKKRLFPVDFDDLIKIYRLTVNILLYISSNGADLQNVNPPNLYKLAEGKKNPAKKEKLLRQAVTSTSLPFILVGSNIGQIKRTGSTGDGTKLSHQVRVAGHWRGQWKGSEKEGNRRKEIIRIESYIKGPEFSEEINKRYIVK